MNQMQSLQIDKDTIVDAFPDTFWAIVGDWRNASYMPGVQSVELDPYNPLHRELDYGDQTADETLLSLENRALEYRIDRSRLPVRNFRGRVAVTSLEGISTKVRYTASFQPAGDTDPEIAARAVSAFVDETVTHMRKMFQFSRD